MRVGAVSVVRLCVQLPPMGKASHFHTLRVIICHHPSRFTLGETYQNLPKLDLHRLDSFANRDRFSPFAAASMGLMQNGRSWGCARLSWGEIASPASWPEPALCNQSNALRARNGC